MSQKWNLYGTVSLNQMAHFDQNLYRGPMTLLTDAISGPLIFSLLYIDVFEITVLSEIISGWRFEPPLHADHYHKFLCHFTTPSTGGYTYMPLKGSAKGRF